MRFILLAAILSSGCTLTFAPPEDIDPAQSATVYLVQYNNDHASIILPEDNETLREYAYGDWNWYAKNKMSFMDGVVALLVPSQAALGSRVIDVPPDAICDVYQRLGGAATVEALYIFPVEIHRLHELRENLLQIWKPSAKPIYNRERDLWFVKHPAKYSLLHNSNHQTEAWLNELGVQTRGIAMLSSFAPCARSTCVAQNTENLTAPRVINQALNCANPLSP